MSTEFDTSYFTNKNTILLPDQLMLLALRKYFSDLKNQQYRYTNDPMKTGILIESRDTFSEEHLNKRPAISVVTGPMQWSNLVIADGGDKYNTVTEYGSGVDLISGTLIINCYSSLATESKVLGWIVNIFIKSHQEFFRNIGFYDIYPSNLGMTSQLLQETLHVTPINVNIVMSVEWVDRFKKALWEGCFKLDGDYLASEEAECD